MKTIDIVALVLIVVGALNWGLVGVANFDLVKALFGPTVLASIVYTLVGLAGLYELIQFRAMQRRWTARPQLA